MTKLAVIVKSPPILSCLRRLPAGLGLAGAERDPQAVVLPLERLLLAERLGVERRLVELLGVERPGVVADVAREEADQEQSHAVHRMSSIDERRWPEPPRGTDRRRRRGRGLDHLRGVDRTEPSQGFASDSVRGFRRPSAFGARRPRAAPVFSSARRR